jgi:hypothetical protein
VTAVAVGQRQRLCILVSGCSPVVVPASSKVVIYTKGSKWDLTRPLPSALIIKLLLSPSAFGGPPLSFQIQ